MILVKIAFIIFKWIYWIGNGITEGMTAKNGHWESQEDCDDYHMYRLFVEDLGVHGTSLILLIALFGFWRGVFLYFATTIVGDRLYDFAFQWGCGRPLSFERTWTWKFRIPFTKKVISIPYPSFKAKIVITIVGVILTIISIYKG